MQPAIAQRMQEQAARQPVLQAAGGVAGFVLQVQLDAGEAGQRQWDQVRVAAALVVGLDAADGLAHPGSAPLEAAGTAHWTTLRTSCFGMSAWERPGALMRRSGAANRAGARTCPAECSAIPWSRRPWHRARRVRRCAPA